MSLTLPIRQSPVAVESAAELLSDAVLVAHAQADPHAFAGLYGRYVDKVHQYCYRHLDTREAAEDATSQVFLQALAALPRYRSERGTFRSWLFTIAHNVIVDQYRSRSPAGGCDELDDLADQRASPEELAEAADGGRALREALISLPARQRQVVELRLAGLTSVEIAEVMQCKPRSVDVAQFRAVAKLRILMGVVTSGAEDIHD